MDDRPSASTAASRAVRAAARIDRTAISWRAGALAAIPVFAVLAVGTLAGRPVAAVTMGAGAMLSGVAWRGGGGPATPPIGTMVAAAVGLAVATVTGTLSGKLPWLHLGLLAVFCLGGGLLTALGRRGGVVGVQTVIAFVVFGRFPEDVAGAFTLAGLALAGGGVQIGFSALVARPPTWRSQRTAVAGAYRALSTLASDPAASSIPAATACDEAEHRITAPALFADQAAVTLSGLVTEGRRIRIEVAALRGLRGVPEVGRALEEAAELLQLIAEALESRGALDQALDAKADALRSWGAANPRAATGAGLSEATRVRLRALAGQLRAAVRLTTQSNQPPARRLVAHPTLGTRRPLAHLPGDLRRLRASATLDSATGRHAVRLAVAVTLTELLAQRSGLPRGYWAVIAAATALRPEFGATFTRGAERMLGTTGGVIVASLIAVALLPAGWGIVGIVGLLAWVTYSVFPASFAAGTAGITAVVVFLLHPVAPSSVTVALDRGIDTVVGGAIGVGVYLLWPTWSGRSADRLLADVVEAQRRYLRAVFELLLGGGAPNEAALRRVARRARIAYSDAEAAVTLTHSEPLHGIDPRLASATLVGLRRLVYSIHALRADLLSVTRADPRPGFAPLGQALDQALELIRDALQDSAGGRGHSESTLPPLRQIYGQAVGDPAAATQQPVANPLDELIDAVNTVASGLGMTLP